MKERYDRKEERGESKKGGCADSSRCLQRCRVKGALSSSVTDSGVSIGAVTLANRLYLFQWNVQRNPISELH
jgi:hypothetical protein